MSFPELFKRRPWRARFFRCPECGEVADEGTGVVRCSSCHALVKKRGERGLKSYYVAEAEDLPDLTGYEDPDVADW